MSVYARKAVWSILCLLGLFLLLPLDTAFGLSMSKGSWRRRSKRLMLHSQQRNGESNQDSFSMSNQTESCSSSNCNKDNNDSSQAKPDISVGIVADIQYAPIPDGTSYSGTPRYYRNSLSAARAAALHFQAEQLPLVLNLGDIVDGKCQEIVRYGGSQEQLLQQQQEQQQPSGQSHDELVNPGLLCTDHVLDALSPYQAGKMIHAYGNHCLYNMNRIDMRAKLGIPFFAEPCGELVGYHTIVHENWRFIVLDCYDVAKLRRSETSTKYQRADTILKRHNPNYHSNDNSPEGLNGLAKRFVAFNGGVGPLQLAWLRDTLQKARTHQECVILVSHLPLLPGSTNAVCLLWNHAEVLKILRAYRDVVALSLSGHAHRGGYRRDPKSGIHFRVVEAVLENPSPADTFAVLDIYPDRLKIRGYGNCESAEYKLDHLHSEMESRAKKEERATIVDYSTVQE